MGADNLLLHKQFRLGGRSIEQQWRDDALRSVSALWEAPESEGHVVGYGASGPVAYLRSEPEFGYGIFGSNALSGRLSLHASPFKSLNALSPLGVEVFSGLGSVWSGGAFLAGFRTDDLRADAGVGLSYGLGDIPHLSRWTAQSDVLEDLTVIARFPFYASDPDLIEQGQDEFDVRWMIGVQVQP